MPPLEAVAEEAAVEPEETEPEEAKAPEPEPAKQAPPQTAAAEVLEEAKAKDVPTAKVLVVQSPVSDMQIVRKAHAYSRLEATESKEREMEAHAAAAPTPAIMLETTAEKRPAEEAEEAAEAPKAEEPAPEVPEQPAVVRAPDPSYHEQLVKAGDEPKSAEDIGGDLGYDPSEIRALDVRADQRRGQLDLAESLAAMGL